MARSSGLHTSRAGVTASVLGGLVVIAFVILERLDVALSLMHLEQDRPGGFGAVASPESLFRPGEAAKVLAGWAHWINGTASIGRGPGDVVAGYVLVDAVFVVLPLTVVLILAIRAARGRGRSGDHGAAVRALLGGAYVMTAIYALADLAETLGVAAAWQATQDLVIDATPARDVVAGGGDGGALVGAEPLVIIGAASLLKWTALALVILALIIALIADRLRTAASRTTTPAAARAVPPTRRTPLSSWIVLRGQLVVVALVVGILLALSGDMGRQVDDVVIRVVETAGSAVLSILAAMLLAMVLFFGSRATLAAYDETPVAAPWGRRPVLLGFGFGGVALIGGAVALALRDVLGDWSAVGAPFAVAGGGVVLFFLLSFPKRVREYIPRPRTRSPIHIGVVLAIAATAPAALILSAVRAAVTLWVDRGDITSLALWAVVIALVTVLLLYLLHRRYGGSEPTVRRPRVRVAVWSAAAVVSLVLGAVWGERFAEAIGTVTTIVLAALFLATAVTALVLIGDALPARGALAVLGLRRVPVVALVLVLGLGASIVDRQAVYYDARLSPDAAAQRLRLGGTPGDGTPAALQAWLTQQPFGTVPLVLVASSGGGIRAAYWSTIAWECLYGDGVPSMSEEADCDGDLPSESVFLVSTVSGSSVGMAMVRANSIGSTRSDDEIPSTDANGDGNWLDDAFAEDYVAPSIAAAVFRDLPNSIMRLPVTGADRASSLERALEGGNPGMAVGFTAAARKNGRAHLPFLLFNGTSVEDGCRMAVSPLEAVTTTASPGTDCTTTSQFVAPAVGQSAPRPANGVLSATKDAFDWTCSTTERSRDLRLSTAALLSARFPFVSPSAGMTSCDDADAHSYVLDGGLLENSGADALVEVWQSLEPAVRAVNTGGSAADRCIQPRLLLLDNAFAGVGSPGPESRSLQLLTPGVGVASVARSQDVAAQQEALLVVSRAMASVGAACEDTGGGQGTDEPGAAAAYLYPRARPGSQAPLGWALADRSRVVLRDELDSPANIRQLEIVRDWYDE